MSNPQVVHSKLSFSGRERWRACPISVHMSAGMPDDSSVAAEEGTLAHTVAEHYVRARFMGGPAGDTTDVVPPAGLDLKGSTVEQWNADLRRHGQGYRDFIASLIPADEPHAVVAVEQKVSISDIHDQLFGTADCLIWLPQSRKLVVVDYKYGFGQVDVGTADAPNPQLSAYLAAGAGALIGRHMLPQSFAIAVYQPRVPLRPPGQVLELPYEWLAQERDRLTREVAAVNNPGEPVPGDHCRYCKGKPRCPKIHNALAAALAAHCSEKNVLDIPEDDLIQIFAARAGFKAFWEDVEERVSKLAKSGHANLTIKESQGRQMWADPAAVTLTLLAMGRADLLQPVALSEALPHIPEAFQPGLVRRSAPSRSIKVVKPGTPKEIQSVFKKYAKSA